MRELINKKMRKNKTFLELKVKYDKPDVQR